MKTKTAVNEVVFRDAVGLVEASGGLANRSILCVAVADQYNALVAKTGEKHINAGLVGLRLKEFNLLDTLKTPKGVKGRKKGSKNTKTDVAVTNSEAVVETPSEPETPAPQVTEAESEFVGASTIVDSINTPLPYGEVDLLA